MVKYCSLTVPVFLDLLTAVRAGTSFLWRKAERTGGVKSGEDSRRSYCGLSVLKGGL